MDGTNTTGLCECGCGEKTRLAPQSVTRDGYIRGQPIRFINGHYGKKAVTKTYRGIRMPDGTQRDLHRVRAERALGKPLPLGVVVHHADGSRSDNAALVICQDETYHKLLHVRMRIVKAGGNPNTDKICGRCRLVKPRSAFHVSVRVVFGVSNTCKECRRKTPQRRKDGSYYPAKS